MLVECLNCHTQNRKEAKFCSKCGNLLRSEPQPSVPLTSNPADAQIAISSIPDLPGNARDQQPLTHSLSVTKPLIQNHIFDPRPQGAIFQDRFLLEQLIFAQEQLYRYFVREFGFSPENRLQQCPNLTCGAIYAPQANNTERYCSSCGSQFTGRSPALVLQETAGPIFGCADEVSRLGLSHSAVRAPIVAFEEKLAGKSRFCLITPYTTPTPSQPEQSQILDWSIDLAYGLEYLHVNGVSFAGQINQNCFGMAEDKVVWAGFEDCQISAVLDTQSRSADVVALAAFLWRWLSGQTEFSQDSTVPVNISALFERALTNLEFTTGHLLAEAFEMAQSTSLQTVDYRLGQRTDVGKARNLNEDSIFALQVHKIQQSQSQPLGLYVVADGMGGHSRGEVASGAIISTIAERSSELLVGGTAIEEEPSVKWLQDTISLANKVVYDLRQGSGSDMGSTIVVAFLNGSKAYIGHVGDSRGYLVNAQGIQPLTTDHSLVERLIATNQITREEARHHPQSNVIYRVMGDKPLVEADPTSHVLHPGDRLLLCSDGLSGMVEDENIRQIVMDAPSPQEACDRLIEAANLAGGDDNISVILIEIVQS